MDSTYLLGLVSLASAILAVTICVTFLGQNGEISRNIPFHYRFLFMRCASFTGNLQPVRALVITCLQFASITLFIFGVSVSLHRSL